MQKNSGIFSATQKSDVVFNSARHHSLRVQFFKKGLPIAAVLIALVFSYYTFFATPSSADLVVIQSDEGIDGKLTMTEPRLEGYTKDKKPYSLKADKAIQDPSSTGIIELLNIQAQLPMGVRGQASVDALKGIYDNINGRLQLDKPFIVKTNDGMVAKFQSANINLSTSQLNTTEPVDIKRDGQQLKANRLEIRDSGQILKFGGGVRLVIDNAIDNKQ